ncbi:MAG: hypothetical protein ACRDVG_01835 [Jatrophihabitantaceae bacterium]
MGKRVVVLVLGVIVLLVGAIAAVGGGALMVAFGTDSTLASGQQPLSTQKVALVASMDDIKDTNGVAAVIGRPTLRLSLAGSGHDVFIGIGPAAAVDRYLAGRAIDRVTDLEADPFRLKTVARDGSGTPAAPCTQTFWTVQSRGANASFTWKITDGSYRLVVMNADASPGVDATGSVGLKVPNLFAIGLGVLIGGVVLALVGVALLMLGARMRRHPSPAPAAPPVIKTAG